MTNGKKLQLLVVGALPPPLAGPSVSVRIFCEEARNYSDKLNIEIINSAPKELGQKPLFTPDHFMTARHIFSQFYKRIRHVDRVLIFGANQFLASIGLICLNAAKVAGKPCYLRAFGQLYESLNPAWRLFCRKSMRSADGIFVETNLLCKNLKQSIGNNVHWISGFRRMAESGNGYPSSAGKSNGKLNLVFLSHVREEKGIFVLLESLRELGMNGNDSVQCDIFGPVYDATAERFKNALAATKNACYRGIINADQVIPTMRQYDVMVFPSHYQGEGHPGVVMESMMAGIPIITTKFRAIPELVEEGVNGLLVPPKDPQNLAKAIQMLRENPKLRADMGQRNWSMRKRYDAKQITQSILTAMKINI